MAAVSKNDIPDIAEFMADLWTFTKNWWNPEKDKQWLKDMWQAGYDLKEKYKNQKYVSCIMTGACTYLAVEWRRMNVSI